MLLIYNSIKLNFIYIKSIFQRWIIIIYMKENIALFLEFHIK